jgi:hypothetical protein
MGYAYVKYYEITGKQKYLTAAFNCADALAKYVKKDCIPPFGTLAATQTRFSPWPFRLNARTGKIHDLYCSNVIEPIKMFDEILRIKNNINLDTTRIRLYTETRNIAKEWLFSKSGPMKTYVWNGYFEDIIGDEYMSNRNQTTPMETARYLLKHPEMDKRVDIDVQALIYYVKSVFGDEKYDAIKEQTWCFEPMASHSARYASVCAMFYARTGNTWFKEQALRNFNYGTYAVEPSGAAWVGHTWPGSWWSDGYSDFIKHYFDGMAAIPEWAPADENHLIKSQSAVIKINYTNTEINFQTYDAENTTVVRLAKKPNAILIDNKPIATSDLKSQGYQLSPVGKNWILRIKQTTGKQVSIKL